MFLSLSQIFGQNVNAFFEEVGDELLATLAHPTNTFKYAESKITDRGIRVDIYYEGYNTSLLVKKRGPLFTGIEVLRDNDFVPPFSAVEVIKNYLIEQSNSAEDQKVKSNFERVIRKDCLSYEWT